MNLRPGIDTPPPETFLFVKLNLPFDDRATAMEVLKGIEAVRREVLDPARRHQEKLVVEDLAHNLLVAFGLPFFLGPLEERGQEEPVQNFPPGGVFTPRKPTRFGMKGNVPLYLRTMAAAGDIDFVKRRIQEVNGNEPAEDVVQAAYRKWVSDAECDLFLYIEGKNRFLNLETWNRIRERVVEPHGIGLAGPIQESMGREDGRDLIGWFDPKSNLDDEIADDPSYYRSKIYLPHPAPMYPGEPTTNRDHPRLDGGTYMVHRKYVEDLEKWNSGSFSYTDYLGKKRSGEDARNYAVGRDRETGRIISASSGAIMEPEKGAAEVFFAPVDSHIAMARGRTPAPFEAPFPPLRGDEVNVFHLQDIRIRRRGGNWHEVDPKTGKPVVGLHFVCFQNNIQQTGFEFINNIWLLNPMFRLNNDPLLDPVGGIAEPIEGSYYFVPPEHRDYPGEVFFE